MRKKQRQHGRVQIPAMTVLLLCFIFMGYETWALTGLKVVHGGSHESITTDKTELWENVVYDISALAQNGWEFKEQESFRIDSSGGWIKAVDNNSIKTAHLTRTPITNPADLFPVKISGKIYPTAGGDGPPPPTDWSITWKSTGDYHIDPEDKIVAYGDAPIFNYRDTSDNPVTGKWLAYRVDQAPGTFPDTGSSEFTVVTLLRGMGIYTVAATAMDESEKDMANLRVVGVKSVSAADITSDSDTEPKTAYVAVGDSVTVAALPEPSGDWPDSKPTWAGATAEDGSASASFPTDTSSATASGTAVTATCGSSSKSINIVVVEVEAIGAKSVVSTTSSPGEAETLYVAKDSGAIEIAATPLPDVGNNIVPTWEGATGNTWNASFEPSELGGFIVSATLGTNAENKKAIKIVVLPTIEADIKDLPPKNETYASGVDAGSLVLKLNGVEITPTITDIENGKHVYYAPSIKELKTGDNEVSLAVKDNAANETEPAPFTWSFEMK